MAALSFQPYLVFEMKPPTYSTNMYDYPLGAKHQQVSVSEFKKHGAK